MDDSELELEDTAEYIAAINEYRARKDEAFGASPESPIIPAQRGAHFAGLKYFPPDAAYHIVAEVVPFEQPTLVQLGSTKGDVRPQLRFAEVRFTLAGQPLKLIGYRDPDASDDAELFVPFRDTTTGKESYGAGRYLEIELETDADGAISAELDFNLAYSPWCAYNPAYSCTLPPVENTLPVAIRAGEQTYEAHS